MRFFVFSLGSLFASLDSCTDEADIVASAGSRKADVSFGFISKCIATGAASSSSESLATNSLFLAASVAGREASLEGPDEALQATADSRGGEETCSKAYSGRRGEANSLETALAWQDETEGCIPSESGNIN